jgi:hypothetical protein
VVEEFGRGLGDKWGGGVVVEGGVEEQRAPIELDEVCGGGFGG